jgi:ATP phosphoribosyltransferase regulatory subunit
VHLDLGAVRDWGYYTGPTFEVFSDDSGFALGSGGRYDTLLSRFGTALPATGFVLHVDRCHDSIARRAGSVTGSDAVHVSWENDAYDDALELARSLRNRGVACVCDLDADGDGVVRVTASGVRWSHRGRDEHGTVDAAVTALVSRPA